MNHEAKPRTAYQKFKLIMELFEHYAQLLVDQCWIEVVVFEIPRVNLTRRIKMIYATSFHLRYQLGLYFKELCAERFK